MMTRQGTGSDARPPWTRRQLIAIASVAVVVAVQLTVPALVAFSDPVPNTEYPRRFGWQMFAQTVGTTRYQARTADAKTLRVDPVREIPGFWGHVNYDTHIPRRLCNADPLRVAIVRLTFYPDGDREQVTFSCR